MVGSVNSHGRPNYVHMTSRESEFVVQKFQAESRFKSPSDIRRMLSSFSELLFGLL